jgi:hypothetical protein
MVPQCIFRLTLPYTQVTQVTQAELRPSLVRAQECSPLAQVKAAATHVQILKQNQRKKKLSVTFVVISDNIFSNVIS